MAPAVAIFGILRLPGRNRECVVLRNLLPLDYVGWSFGALSVSSCFTATVAVQAYRDQTLFTSSH
jgi:hypothetical protein